MSVRLYLGLNKHINMFKLPMEYILGMILCHVTFQLLKKNTHSEPVQIMQINS